MLEINAINLRSLIYLSMIDISTIYANNISSVNLKRILKCRKSENLCKVRRGYIFIPVRS